MNGGSTVHSRHGDDPGRTRTCQMAENARSSSAHVLSPQACQSAHGITRLASPCAVGLLIAHFKPSANSGPRGGGCSTVNFTQPISIQTILTFAGECSVKVSQCFRSWLLSKCLVHDPRWALFRTVPPRVRVISRFCLYQPFGRIVCSSCTTANYTQSGEIPDKTRPQPKHGKHP